jgi:hypothetical protein
MGGQACVLYGGAEFSRDTDLAILGDDANLDRLQAALKDLQGEVIAVPPFDRKYLDMGLAVHFRCRHPEAMGMRVDVMSRLRGVDDFETIWRRRTTFTVTDMTIDAMSLPDLVKAKKTQRDKDWPMIGRLIEVNYLKNRGNPSEEQISFWLHELRSPGLLIEAAANFPRQGEIAMPARPLLECALRHDEEELRRELRVEEEAERNADVAYWLPLKAILVELRSAKPR